MKFVSKKFNELTTKEVYEILKVRSQIFIVEQKMNCLDMDGADYGALHCFITENEKIVAYLRAFPNEDTVKIGRVLTTTHGVGLGRKIIEQSILHFKKTFECKKIELHSQITAVGFYKKLGFKITSGEFLEENVIHVSMELEI